jgi:hypothetical protein
MTIFKKFFKKFIFGSDPLEDSRWVMQIERLNHSKPTKSIALMIVIIIIINYGINNVTEI